jgi:hypothetical protein
MTIQNDIQQNDTDRIPYRRMTISRKILTKMTTQNDNTHSIMKRKSLFIVILTVNA